MPDSTDTAAPHRPVDARLRPPSFLQSLGEIRAAREPLRLPLRTPSLVRSPRGDGAPVVVVPGFGATDASMAALRGFLRRLGHDARPAGLGRVSDDVDAQRVRLGEMLHVLHDESGRRVNLVGWSIGGVVSREAARDRSHAVGHVVTFGTPVEGGPSYTSLSNRYTREELEAVRDRIDERSVDPIESPITAIWSRRDGVVAPDACIDHRSPRVEHVEVTSTHLGMGLDPDVWAIVADRLASATHDRSRRPHVS